MDYEGERSGRGYYFGAVELIGEGWGANQFWGRESFIPCSVLSTTGIGLCGVNISFRG